MNLYKDAENDIFDELKDENKYLKQENKKTDGAELGQAQLKIC